MKHCVIVLFLMLFSLSARDWKLIPNSLAPAGSGMKAPPQQKSQLAQAVYFKNNEIDDHMEKMFIEHFSQMAQSFGIQTVISLPSGPVNEFLLKNGFEKTMLSEQTISQSGIGYELAKYLNSRTLLLCYFRVKDSDFNFTVYCVDTQHMQTHTVSFSCRESEFLQLQNR